MKLSPFAALLALSVPAAAGTQPLHFPAHQQAGPFRSGHVQGIALDRKGGFIYYSFTNMIAKYDLNGRLVGTLTGWSGHLGDLDFNDADGKIYGSLEYGKQDAFYIAIIDGNRIDRMNMTVQGGDMVKTVYLPEVTRDYAAATPAHRYGCSGIDGVAFGPAFGRMDGAFLLTVAYGVYGDVDRTDNDHQLLLQYDVSDWARHARPLSEDKVDREGPGQPRAKVFVRTGNTRYGVQNLAYDPSLGRWFMGVYTGAKPDFPNYGMFAVDARSRPAMGDLTGVPDRSGHGWEQGLTLPLAQDGLVHGPSGIRGWNQKADVGIQPLGGGLYYLATNIKDARGQSADIRLMRWTGDAQRPFAPDKGGR